MEIDENRVRFSAMHTRSVHETDRSHERNFDQLGFRRDVQTFEIVIKSWTISAIVELNNYRRFITAITFVLIARGCTSSNMYWYFIAFVYQICFIILLIKAFELVSRLFLTLLIGFSN